MAALLAVPLGASPAAATEVPVPTGAAAFATAATDGHLASGHPLNEAGMHPLVDPHGTPDVGSGFLAFFQEASSVGLTVSIGGAPAESLAEGAFTYGPVPAGSYTITVTDGTSAFASGTVSVGDGQDVTALVYLAVGGQPTVSGFVNDRSPLAVGQSRMAFRNTANVGPVDVYVNGNRVASGLVNSPSSPSVTIDVPTGPMTIEVVPANKPESESLFAQNGFLVAGDLLNVFVIGDFTTTPSTISFLTNANPLGSGYRLYASDGGVFDFGNANYYGSMGGKHLNKPIVGAAPTSNGIGYWLAASDGGVFTFGDAGFYGSTGNLRLSKPIVGMASTTDDGGYWLVASDGGVFSFGDAKFYGSTGNIRLNQPIVAMAATPDGGGYWLVASDGGVFSFGDAKFFGSTGGLSLNKPIMAIVSTVDGGGYWLVASDGGVFSFGDASFYGSTGNVKLNQPIVGAITTPDSLGYWLVASDGGVFSFGDASFYGSTGSMKLVKPIVVASPDGAPLPAY
jgi:hypothetical protein